MLATLWTLIGYETVIVPRARREVRRWARRAAAIPDRRLRAHATGAIAADTGNAVAIAALAATAPRGERHRTTALVVTYQLLVDYVDELGERVCADQLAHGMALGGALTAALAAPSAPLDLDPLGDDGGYLVALVTACRGLLWQLPSAAVIEHDAHRAATRCAHAMAYTHEAAERNSTAELERWATAREDADGYAWWETAGGAASNIAVTALLAAAAEPALTHREAQAISSAYWPHVCVLSTMLDSLVDCETDARTGDFSFVSHYPDDAAICSGLLAAATNSLDATRTLPHRRTHAMIVGGIAGYYAATAAPESLASRIAPRLLRALRPAVTPIALALRAQRGIGALRGAA